METSPYQQAWQRLQTQTDPGAALGALAQDIARAFVDQYDQKGHYRADHIDLLCEMATYYEDDSLSNTVCSSLFGIVVESLCDDFEDMPLGVYTRVMSQVITTCRALRAGEALDEALLTYGITGFADLYQRSNHVHVCEYTCDPQHPLRRIILLSRVTIGADVAILSVIIQRMAQLFPEAEIVVVGNDKLRGVFGGHNRVRLVELNYSRRGGLFARFTSWFELLAVLAREMPIENEDETLVIDPDSRLTQLGVLPVTHRDNYLFFNTRVFRPSSQGMRMSERVNRWVDAVFRVSDRCTPRIWIPRAVNEQARHQVEILRQAGCRRIVTVNLGFGGNERKQLGIDFEKALLQDLLKEPGTVVILDRGFGDTEQQRSAEILEAVSQGGMQTAQARLDGTNWPDLSHGVLAVECTIGDMAAMIAESDEFIGYDSACQHIAAACDTPVVTVFAGTNNDHFVQRWSACGRASSHVVHVDTLSDAPVDIEEVMGRIRQARPAFTKQDARAPAALPIVPLDGNKTKTRNNARSL